MKELVTASSKENREQRMPAILSRYWVALQARLAPPVPWIALLGVDGSGKSSVLEMLEQEIAATPFTGLVVIHRRPKLAYAETNTQSGIITHYSKPPHGRLKSIVKLLAIVLDWQIGYWGHVARQRSRKQLVICDRHALLDLLVDPSRYRYGGPSRLVKLALVVVPMPDAVLLLDASPDVLQARKQELSMAETAALRNAYLQLVCGLSNGYVIDAAKPLEQVVEQVRRTILEIS